MAVVERALTLEEFLALPEEEPALEYWDGVITQKVSPQADHGMLQFLVAELFNNVARPRQLGLAFTETRFSTGRRSPVPDVSFYVKDRIRLRLDGMYEDFREPPDIAVEILSPGQRVNPLIRKCLGYLELGTRVALLVDPEDRSILEFRPGRPVRVLQGDDRIELDEVLPGFELTVRQLFDALVPPWLAGAPPAEQREQR